MVYDTSIGRYSVSGDSIYFFYNYSKDDSSVAKTYSKVLEMSLDSALLLHLSNFRAYSAIFYHNSVYFKDVVLMRGR